MEMRNKLDEEIRAKLENFEAEPSAKVWMNIRREVGEPKPRGTFFTWGIAAAAAILLFATGVILLRDGAPEQTMTATQLEYKGDSSILYAWQSASNNGFFFIQPKELKSTPGPVLNQIQNLAQQNPVRKEIQNEIPRQDQSPLNQQPVPDAPIADKDLPVEDEELQNIPPQVTVQLPPKNSIAMGKEAETRSSKRKSSAPLKLIAKAGKDILGLDMDYKESEKGNNKQYAFHADLGFMKIDRTKSINP
jgi:hypothetical protein